MFKLEDLFVIDHLGKDYQPIYEIDEVGFICDHDGLITRVDGNRARLPLIFVSDPGPVIIRLIMHSAEVNEAMYTPSIYGIHAAIRNHKMEYRHMLLHDNNIVFDTENNVKIIRHPLVPEDTVYITEEPEFTGILVKQDGRCGFLAHPRSIRKYFIGKDLYNVAQIMLQ